MAFLFSLEMWLQIDQNPGPARPCSASPWMPRPSLVPSSAPGLGFLVLGAGTMCSPARKPFVEHDLGLAVAVGVEAAADVANESHCVEYCSAISTGRRNHVGHLRLKSARAGEELLALARSRVEARRRRRGSGPARPDNRAAASNRR